MVDRAYHEAIARLRKLPARPFYVWLLEPANERVGRGFMGEVLCPWPYVHPSLEETALKRGWGQLWVHGGLNMANANSWLSEQLAEIAKRLGYAPTVSSRDQSIGAMFCMRFEAHDRGGPRRWLFTPPVYKFCDLDKEFPDTATPVPHDFWVQPEVYAETGQILQGSPSYNATEIIDDHLIVSKPRELQSMLRERREYQPPQGAFQTHSPEKLARGIEQLEFIQIALDAWIDRYERTGATVAAPEFVWTMTEEREQLAKKLKGRCSEPQCRNAASHQAKAPSGESWFPLCDHHAGDLRDEPNWTIRTLPKGNPASDFDLDLNPAIVPAYKFAGTADVIELVREAAPSYDYVDEPDTDRGERYRGRRVTWIGSPGLTLKIPAKNVLFMEGNSWYPEHAAALLEKIEGGDAVFETPIARVHRVTARDVKTTEKYEKDGELEYQTNMLAPWRREEVGEYYAQLTDGNHRAAAALAAGEPFIYVYVSPNHRDVVRKKDFE